MTLTGTFVYRLVLAFEIPVLVEPMDSSGDAGGCKDANFTSQQEVGLMR